LFPQKKEEEKVLSREQRVINLAAKQEKPKFLACKKCKEVVAKGKRITATMELG